MTDSINATQALTTAGLLTHSVHYSEWLQGHFRDVNKFYKKQNHKGSASGDERVFIATRINPDGDSYIIAAVRLVPAERYYWLRSLYVDQTLRQSGIGSKLLAHVKSQIDQTIHCFPYPHLEHFYAKAGYELTPIEDLPNPLQQLYQRYNKKSDSIIVMSQSLT